MARVMGEPDREYRGERRNRMHGRTGRTPNWPKRIQPKTVRKQQRKGARR